MKPFSVVLRDAVAHGALAGVALPAEPDPVPSCVLDRLHPAERGAALSMAGFRQVQWVGGRLAARVALRALGRAPGPVLFDCRGAPVCRGDACLSITHKRHLAVALAARRAHGTIGVDLEALAPARPGVEAVALTEAEGAEVGALPEHCRWTSVVLRFAVKEAVYKALAPRLGRHVGFHEVEACPATDGAVRLRLRLAGNPVEVDVSARYAWLDDCVLATARARWSQP